jgi:hypothetical protein
MSKNAKQYLLYAIKVNHAGMIPRLDVNYRLTKVLVAPISQASDIYIDNAPLVPQQHIYQLTGKNGKAL